MNCPVCGDAFPGEAILDRHLSVEHPDADEDLARAHDEAVAREHAERAEAERLRNVIPVRPKERESFPANERPTRLTTLDMLDRLTGGL